MATQVKRRVYISGIAVALLAALACGANMEFDYLQTNGPGDIPLRMTVRNGIAEVLRSPESPREGQPIGLFRGPVSPGFLEALERELPEQNPSGPPPGRAMPVTQIRFVSPKRSVSFQAVSAPPKVLQLVRQEADRLPAIRAIQVEFLHLTPDHAFAEVRLTNPGSEPVSLESATLNVYGVQQSSRRRLGTLQPQQSIPAAGHIEARVPVQFPAMGDWLLLAEYTMQAATAAQDAAKKVAGAASSTRTTVRLP